MNIIHVEDEEPRVVCAECEFKFLEQHYFPHEFSESFWTLLSKKVGFWKALFDWIWEGIEKSSWAWVIIMTRWLQGRHEIWVHSLQGLWWVREDPCRLRVRQPSSTSVPGTTGQGFLLTRVSVVLRLVGWFVFYEKECGCEQFERVSWCRWGTFSRKFTPEWKMGVTVFMHLQVS